jgi:subtilisin-like proprotein convertase family protein
VVQNVLVSASITHTYRGDLVVQVIAPDGQVATLSNRAGGSADDFAVAGLDITSSFAPGTPRRARGSWWFAMSRSATPGRSPGSA